MKRFALFTIFFGYALLIIQCNSKTRVDQKDGTIDTVVVRDTVIVVEKHVFVNAIKMNVLYIGVDNPVRVELAGVNPSDIRAEIFGGAGKIQKAGDKDYMVTVAKPGAVKIRLSGSGLQAKEFDYTAKRIPDPVARFSNSSGGTIGTGEFKAQGGLGAFLDNFDFDARCAIQGFNLTRVPRRADPIEVVNTGPRFNDKSSRLIRNAKPGDVYYFTNVRARCPGDIAGRKINSLVFKIR